MTTFTRHGIHATVPNNLLCIAAIDAGGNGIMRSVTTAHPTQPGAHA